MASCDKQESVRIHLWALIAAGSLAGCASSFDLGATTGGGGSTTAGAGNGGATTGGEDAGASAGLTSSGGSGGRSTGVGGNAGGLSGGGAAGGGTGGLGQPCSPSALSSCGVGEVCDDTSGTCRLPGYGESCNPQVGCATAPPGMTCTQASYNGSSEELCLIPCTASDSSACPYGTSCGDSSLPDYCSPQGAGVCSAWGPCALGGGVSGLCIPEGKRNVCYALGTEPPFAPCDPQASNDDAAALCDGGMLCIPNAQAPATLRASVAGLAGGTCFPLCLAGPAGSVGLLGCADSQHCYQPPGAAYGTCLPGSPCTAGESHCPAVGWWCLPDDVDSPSGGCVPSAEDAADAGGPCALPTALDAPCPCTAGAVCLPGANGNDSCQTLCGLDAGGCGYQSCVPVGLDAGLALLGVCE